MSDEFIYDNETHTYKLNGVVIPSVTQILKGAGLVNLDFMDPEILRQKADLGKKVHTTTELYDTEDLFLDDLHPLLQQYLQQWAKFKLDYNFQITDIEAMLYHRVFRYAGRLDRVGTIETDKFFGKVVVDIKSGLAHHSHAIQLAGYSELYNQDKKVKDHIRRRYCVYLSPESYMVKEYNKPTDRNVFLSALTINNYLKQI